MVRVLGATRRPNPEQHACLACNPAVPLLIAAGPGSGKTAVLILRALRHVLVDRVLPERIMITTFTRKAAKEIRTRLIEWGTPLLEALLADRAGPLDADYRAFLRQVDINRFVTGTLDSLCEEALSGARGPGERLPVLVEAFAANQLLARRGEIYKTAERLGQPFLDYLGLYTNTGDPPETLGDMTRVVRMLVDRLVQDEVDLAEYVKPGPHQAARQAVHDIFKRYTESLRSSHQMDFPTLERVFLERLRADRVPDLVSHLGVLLVDEYQDTNPLQEHIYLELARRTGAALTVVGDDDQSLYRFRGATIELFRDFQARVANALGGPAPRLLYLTDNYRSTPEIVSFLNGFIQNDPDFASARIQPPKPMIRANQPSGGVPVLGMFRNNAEERAVDLADFLNQVFRQGGRPADARLAEPIRPSPHGGDLGDAVFLSHTVSEFRRGFRGTPPSERLPWLLRQNLEKQGILCFNPRGRALKDIPEVGRALGLVLECLDAAEPGNEQGRIVADTPLTHAARSVFLRWRQDARALLATLPPAVIPRGESLQEVVARWQRFARHGQGVGTEWPLLDVLYNLLPWMPAFQDDPEHQVYLEAVSRAAAQATAFSRHRSLIFREEPHRTRSIRAVIQDVLAPIADDLVEVDEDIMPSVPRGRLNLMTIHQAKGLEFPLVIVDIASDFLSNHPKQRFRRFPDEPSPVTRLEDDLASCTPIGPLRTARTAIQRSFEDLIRLYYVAYSRPQSVLLLVGCLPCLRYNTTIPHVATFWRRDGTWPWRKPLSGQRPSMADHLPITLL
ncbi:ATP-dependent helicase [Stigmatella aurantiaca]|uniref:ATP-dependent helicase n=1 Tax=Stigmatella aurantiaca TaxID=41 RepID=UPI001EE68CC5|nr:ATP-dependent helicase [Stigmatella aurantiaca]